MTDSKLSLMDAQALHRDHPRTFDAPAAATLALLRADDYVKIGVVFSRKPHYAEPPDTARLRIAWTARIGPDSEANTNGERFWVQLDRCTETEFSGLITNDLVYTRFHGVACGDRVTFEPRHVLQVLPTLGARR